MSGAVDSPSDFTVQPTVYSSEPVADGNLPTLRIFTTEIDKREKDITKMSNYFDIYIQELTSNLSRYSTTYDISALAIPELEIINEVISQVDVVVNGEYAFVPDIDSLPRDIRAKLLNGVYRLGESKQVDGNARAVIVDRSGIRVKDVTLKRIDSDPRTVETTQSIATQLQMRRIYEKLDDVQEAQSYQIDSDRDRALVNPFLNARTNILRAQDSTQEEYRISRLVKATDDLTGAIRAVYSDLSTSSEHLAKLTSGPAVLHRRAQIQTYIRYIIWDLQLAAKYVGVQLHVFDYLGDHSGARVTMDEYQHAMRSFFETAINRKGHSAAALVHQHYPYDQRNLNCWIDLARDVDHMLKSEKKSIEGRETLLVSIGEAGHDG